MPNRMHRISGETMSDDDLAEKIVQLEQELNESRMPTKKRWATCSKKS